MILSGIDIVGVVFGVVDVFFGTVTSKSLTSNLEFAGACYTLSEPGVYDVEISYLTVSKAHEPENPE